MPALQVMYDCFLNAKLKENTRVKMLFRICVVEGIKIQKNSFGLEMILHKPEDLGKPQKHSLR